MRELKVDVDMVPHVLEFSASYVVAIFDSSIIVVVLGSILIFGRRMLDRTRR